MELDITKYKKILQDQIKEIEDERSKHAIQLQELSSEALGTSDIVDCAQTNERETILNSRINQCASKIKLRVKALQLISEGEFGYCQLCGIDIDEETLTKHPERENCISCMQLKEKQGKHYIK
ncbi:hypothetical protein [Vibrio sp. D431a]|uniref:TraR/DksA family transcriptional regulator n=1 Tax=Vibrio sp. D431a TaxID=2837388 RepID=UPI0025578EEE|nr:hypothetical protein [Vibrio sp. D431a]MDK9790081.1 hypothetical protein [Vibrio sp. D431a]